MRRIYTHEGEFYGLDEAEALLRLEAGLEVFDRHGWPVAGFVAPAWLMSEGTRQALRRLPLRYTSTPQHLYRLPEFTAIQAPAWCGAPAVLGDGAFADDLRLARATLAQCSHAAPRPASRGYASSGLSRLLVADIANVASAGTSTLTKSAWLARQVQA